MVFGSKQDKLFKGGGHHPKPQAFVEAHRSAGKGLPKMAYYLIGLIVVIAAVYLLLGVGASGGSSYVLTTNKTLSMSQNQTVLLQSSGTAQPVAVEMANYSGKSYTFLFTKTPVLANPVYTFTLTQGQVINLSDTGSSNADLQAKLVSASGGSATVEFIPIPASFGVKATTLTVVSPGSGSSQQNASTTVATTTVSSNATTTASSTTAATTAATTTVSGAGGSYTDAQVIAAASATQQGNLMNKYEALYSKDQGCTAPSYNASYKAMFSANATGSNDYWNASKVTPYNITASVGFLSGTSYYVNYSTVSHSSLTTGTALSLLVNAQNSQAVSATFSGIFAHQTYAQVNSTYNTQASISGLCGAYLP